MGFLIFLFFLFFTKPVLATPSVVINSAPSIVTAGTTFPITFTITDASSSATYCYKFFGGIGTDVDAISSDSTLSYSSLWLHFPQITLDSESSSNIFNGYAFINPGAATSNYNLKITIVLPDHTNISVTSPVFPIDVTAAPPTPTPIPTQTPTPTNSPTPTPTLIPTKVSTPTPTPDLNKYSASDSSTDSAIIEPTDSGDNTADTSTDTPAPTSGSVLGETTPASKTNFLPLIFIIAGGILLLSPFIITKIKNVKNKIKDDQ